MKRERILYYIKRMIFNISPKLAAELGFDFRMNVPNRCFLEKQVFGLINLFNYNSHNKKCLFLGVKRYTWHYPRLLDAEFYTLDYNQKESKFGQQGKHVVGSVFSLTEYYESNLFSTIIANGLVGFGVNTEDEFNLMMDQIYQVLETGGILVLGYNNCPARLTFDIEKTRGYERYEKYSIPFSGFSLTPYEIQDSSKHCYVFLRKN